ncbi:MAG: beta-ketoacyl-ACP synthase III [Eubacteriales bacterium]
MSISAKIVGVGSYIPEKVVDNHMLESIVDTSDEWIVKRTGISERRVIIEENNTMMAVAAAKQAMDHAGVSADEIGIIVGSTVTSDYATPSLASLVQKGIGCENAAALDVAAGCTGFIYALTAITSMMDTLDIDTGLVIAAENLSCRVDWTDRSNCILFGDGAGAVVVKRSKENHIKFPFLKAIPDTEDVLYIKNKRNDNPWSKNQASDDISLVMKGQEVFVFAVDAMEKAINYLEAAMGDTKIDKIVPHQANNRIIQFAAHSTNFEKDQFYVNVDKYANTSSATIPIALKEAHDSGWLKKGDEVALIGFGAGLTYGGIVVKWAI